MGDISKNFSRSEFECECGCGFATVDIELMGLLEKVRHYFGGKRVTINSGCRCSDHNKAIGGSKNSRHMQGIAADIVIDGVHPLSVYGYIDSIAPDRYGLGSYPTFTHIDVRPNKARWHG